MTWKFEYSSSKRISGGVFLPSVLYFFLEIFSCRLQLMFSTKIESRGRIISFPSSISPRFAFEPFSILFYFPLYFSLSDFISRFSSFTLTFFFPLLVLRDVVESPSYPPCSSSFSGVGKRPKFFPHEIKGK